MWEVLPVFLGFGPEVFWWFDGLERENTREYFTRTRDLYEREVREQLEELLLELGGGDVKVFRQHRDLRFSRDKRPYKERTYGVAGGLYVQISARGMYVGTGYYRVEPDQLERLRAAVADDETGPVLERALAKARLDVAGAELKTAPRGYPRDHPRIALLRHKALIAGRREPPGRAGIGRDVALEHLRGTWQGAAPLNAWLDEHVGPSTLPPPEPRGRR
jgi:uncharacterized protein (TIGR02453 family)